jgi:hypothetical protein
MNFLVHTFFFNSSVSYMTTPLRFIFKQVGAPTVPSAVI